MQLIFFSSPVSILAFSVFTLSNGLEREVIISVGLSFSLQEKRLNRTATGYPLAGVAVTADAI